MYLSAAIFRVGYVYDNIKANNTSYSKGNFAFGLGGPLLHGDGKLGDTIIIDLTFRRGNSLPNSTEIAFFGISMPFNACVASIS